MSSQPISTPADPVAATKAPILDDILKQGNMVRDETQRVGARDQVSEFVEQVVGKSMKVSNDTAKMINDRIAEIDKLLADQLNAIYHWDAFQSLESAWRGLHYLVMNTETGTMLKLR